MDNSVVKPFLAYEAPMMESVSLEEFDEVLASAICQKKFACGSVYS